MGTNYNNYHRDTDYIENERLFRNIFIKHFSLISRYAIKKGNVLDIGCSNGVFLDLFKEKGWKTWGIEPSKSGLVAQKKGHKIIKRYFEKANLPKKYFDLVVMNHTLEHVDNPAEVINKIHKLLKSGGIVFVDVPNFGSLLSKIMGKKWPYLLPLEHKSQFTKETLTKLFIDVDFEILHWESRSGIFEYANPILEFVRPRFLFDLLAIPYSLVATLLNMGDSMSIVARKI